MSAQRALRGRRVCVLQACLRAQLIQSLDNMNHRRHQGFAVSQVPSRADLRSKPKARMEWGSWIDLF